MVTRSRLAIGRRATNKRQTPAPIPPRLFAHMRCWVRRGAVTSHFVEWQGAPVKSLKTGFIGQARKGGRQATTPRRLSCTICGAFRAGLSVIPGISDLVRELVIGHTKPGRHKVYDRTHILMKSALLDAWAVRPQTILNPTPATVVELQDAQ